MSRLLKTRSPRKKHKLQKSAEEKKAHVVLNSLQWKNTEKTIKRSGMVFPLAASFEDKINKSGKIVDLNAIRSLYILYMAASTLRKCTSLQPEVMKISERLSQVDDLSMHYIIVPSVIRKRAYGIKKNNRVEKLIPFQNGIYKHMLRDYGKASTFALINELPLTEKELFLAGHGDFIAYHGCLTLFGLFLLELKRLCFDDEYKQMVELYEIYKSDTAYFETLVRYLYTSLLLKFIDDNASFDSFFYNDRLSVNDNLFSRKENVISFKNQFFTRHFAKAIPPGW